MNTCSTCKWWGEDDYVGYRDCRHPKLDLKRQWPEPLEADGVIDHGMDAGYQDLYTGPSFGCVHHEAK